MISTAKRWWIENEINLHFIYHDWNWLAYCLTLNVSLIRSYQASVKSRKRLKHLKFTPITVTRQTTSFTSTQMYHKFQSNTFSRRQECWCLQNNCSWDNELAQYTPLFKLHVKRLSFGLQQCSLEMIAISPANGMATCEQSHCRQDLSTRTGITRYFLSSCIQCVCIHWKDSLVWVEDFQETLSYFISWNTFKSSVADKPLLEAVEFFVF